MSHRLSKRAGRLTTGVAAVLGAALLLMGCASGGGGGTGGDAQGPTEFIFGVTSEPATLNSATTSDQPPTMIGNQVFDGLVRLDRAGEIQPQLAESWELAEDGLSMKFKLREGVTFHDGEPLTAEDVKFTLEKGLAVSPYAAWMNGIFKEVQIEDDHNFTIVLEAPFAPLLPALTTTRSPILPEHIFGEGDITANPANLAPIGSGPYKYDNTAADGTVTLVKNEDYWDEMGSVETVKMRVIPDPTALANSLKSGEIDFLQTFWMPMEQVQGLQADSKISVEEGRVYPTFTYLNFNTETEALNTPEKRRAVFRAIDQEYILQSAFMGLGKVPDGFIPSAYSWAKSDQVPFAEELGFDKAAAEKQLDEAGLTAGADGKRASLRYVYSPEDQANTQTIGEAIRSNLGEVGIDVELVSLDSATWLETLFQKHDFDLAAVRLNTGGDPSLGIARVYVCNKDNLAYRNPSQYCSDEMDAAWAKVATAAPDERGEAALQAQLLALRDLPNVPLIDETSYDGLSNAFTETEEFWDAFEHAGIRIHKLS